MDRVAGAGVRAVVAGRLAVQELLDHGREGPGTDGMQHLLAAARRDAGAVRDDMHDYVVEQLGRPGGRCWWWVVSISGRHCRTVLTSFLPGC